MEKRKRVLVTAGNTIVPIDQVRSITNIFKGKTGTEIAIYLADYGYQVTLITSNPTLLAELIWKYSEAASECSYLRTIESLNNNIDEYRAKLSAAIKVVPYRTYDELYQAMEVEIRDGQYDIVIHSAAVSDYYVQAVCVMEETPADSCAEPHLIEIDKSKKVSSDYETMYLRLKKTPKIISLIREPWGFKGQLVMFKLQVGISNTELMDIAGKSMRRSQADIIVANCLEWANDRAIIIRPFSTRNTSAPRNGTLCRIIKRSQLPSRLVAELERMATEPKNTEATS